MSTIRTPFRCTRKGTGKKDPPLHREDATSEPETLGEIEPLFRSVAVVRQNGPIHSIDLSFAVAQVPDVQAKAVPFQVASVHPTALERVSKGRGAALPSRPSEVSLLVLGHVERVRRSNGLELEAQYRTQLVDERCDSLAFGYAHVHVELTTRRNAKVPVPRVDTEPGLTMREV